MRAILTYHSIDESGSPISVTPERFVADMHGLASRDIRVVTVDALLALSDEQSAVALTFDDAYVNFASVAWPILQAREWPVTLFVTTGHVGANNVWDSGNRSAIPALPILNWDALAGLAEQGVILGAHSRTHPDLRRVEHAALEEEIDGSFADIERNVGTRPGGFAFPYGHHNDTVVDATKRVCRWACATMLAPLPHRAMVDHFRVPRLDAYFLRGPANLEHYGTPVFRHYLRLRSMLRQLKSA